MEDIIKLQGIFENGYGFIAKKVMKDKNLNVISKAIYSYICSYSGKGQDAFPSQSLICFDLGISKGTLSKYMKELKENGYIKVRQENSKGKFSRNIYTINIVPCIISPYTVKTDTQITVHGQIDTNNNSSNNNNNYNNNKEKSIAKAISPAKQYLKRYKEFIVNSIPDVNIQVLDSQVMRLKQHIDDNLFAELEKSSYLKGLKDKKPGVWVFTVVKNINDIKLGVYRDKEASQEEKNTPSRRVL